MTALRFSSTARELSLAAQRQGLVAPGFRSPPRRPGLDRAIRRWPGGGLVAVRVRGRPRDEVVSDMVDGVLAVNGLSGPAAAGPRGILLAAVGGGEEVAA